MDNLQDVATTATTADPTTWTGVWTALIATLGTIVIAALGLLKRSDPSVAPDLRLTPTPELEQLSKRLTESFDHMQVTAGMLTGRLEEVRRTLSDLVTVRERIAVAESDIRELQALPDMVRQVTHAIEDIKTQQHQIKHSLANVDQSVRSANLISERREKKENDHG